MNSESQFTAIDTVPPQQIAVERARNAVKARACEREAYIQGMIEGCIVVSFFLIACKLLIG